MKKIVIVILSILSLSSFAQNPVGHLVYNFNDPGRTTTGYTNTAAPAYGTGRKIGVEVYYPATIAGDNKAFAAGTFPVVVFGHGFVMTWDSYDNIYNDLAARGYIVVLPRTEGNFSPVHLEFGKDLALCVDSLRLYGNTSGKLVYGHVGTTAAIGGHSMGGGSSFLAAQNNTGIDCLFNFAAANTNPSSITAAYQVTVPTLVMGGAADCVAPNAANQDKMYDSTAASTKFEVIFKALTHCDFGDGTNFNCTFGQNSSGCANAVSNTVATGRYMYYLNNYLDYYLKSDCPAGTRFMDSLNSSPLIIKKSLGDISCITTVKNISKDPMMVIAPNPANELVNINMEEAAGNETITIFNAIGQPVLHTNLKDLNGSAGNKQLDISHLNCGIYFVEIKNDRIKLVKKLVKN